MQFWNFVTTGGSQGFTDGYDAEDRLRNYRRTGAQHATDIYLDRSTPGGANGSIGDIIDIVGGIHPGERTLNNVHQLESFEGPSDPLTQSFNVDGQLATSHTGMTLTWDASGRLKQATVPAAPSYGIEGVHDYLYDCDSRRVSKKTTGGVNDGEHTVYIHAGPNCIAEYSIDPTGDSATLVQQYVYATEFDSLLLIDQPGNPGQKLGVTRNGQWSITALYDWANGSVVERYSYDVFGNRTVLTPNGDVASTQDTDNPYGYTSRRHDEETGLMYFRARYYDPTTGEFVSKDSMEYVDGMSLYRAYFVGQDVDPTGTQLGYKPGKATCRGKPTGVAYVGGRGTFLASLTDFVHEPTNPVDWVNRIGSNFFINFRWNSSNFVDAAGCCCCSSIGYLQVAKTEIHRESDVGLLESWWERKSYFLDGGWPYQGKQMSPCLGKGTLTANDAPNATVEVFGVVRKLRQSFVTCAVCLSGIEGPVGKNPVTGITVYGCVKWGHEITIRSRTFFGWGKRTWNVRRWLWPHGPKSGVASGIWDGSIKNSQSETDLRQLVYQGPGANYTQPHWFSGINNQSILPW